jgi:hypothetical protein
MDIVEFLKEKLSKSVKVTDSFECDSCIAQCNIKIKRAICREPAHTPQRGGEEDNGSQAGNG